MMHDFGGWMSPSRFGGMWNAEVIGVVVLVFLVVLLKVNK
jgi:hypothetical protein